VASSHSATLPQLQPPVLLLKLDTEGAELSALQGLVALLEARQARAIRGRRPQRMHQLIFYFFGFIEFITFSQCFSHFVALKVLNIIAELKPPHRSEIIDMLRAYGFRCMKYLEAYDMVLPSDRLLTLMDGRMAIDRSSDGQPRSIAYYGASCYELGTTSIGQAEVHFNSKFLFAMHYFRFADLCCSSLYLMSHTRASVPGSLVCS